MTHFAEFKRLGLLCNPKSTILNIHDAEISETLGLGFGLSLEYLETRVSVSDPLVETVPAQSRSQSRTLKVGVADL